MSQNDIHQIELSIEEARRIIDRGKMAEKLASNREFKKLILEGYFVDEAARMAHLYSDPNLSDQDREYLLRDMAGIGALKRHLRALVAMGHAAQSDLSEAEMTLEEIRREEYEEAYGESES